MAEAKTVRTGADVPEFLASVPDPRRRADAEAVCALMAEVTGVPPVMWGTSIVGFGAYTYRSASGQRGDWPAIGLSPRRTALTIYLPVGLDGLPHLLSRLGPHTTGRSCLYVKRLSDIDRTVLRDVVGAAFRSADGRTITPGQPAD